MQMMHMEKTTGPSLPSAIPNAELSIDRWACTLLIKVKKWPPPDPDVLHSSAPGSITT